MWSFESIVDDLGAAKAFGGRDVIEKFYKGREDELYAVPWFGGLIGKVSKGKGLAHWIHSHLHTHEGIWMLYFWNKNFHCMEGLVRFGKETEGPRTRVHGGALATVLDEATGVAGGFFSGHACVTIDLHIRYRKFVEAETICIFKAIVVEETETHLVAECELRSHDGSTVHCTARGSYKKYKEVKQVFREQQMEMFQWDPRNRKLSASIHNVEKTSSKL